jgi:TM2 domain-containing membrane protein YozV
MEVNNAMDLQSVQQVKNTEVKKVAYQPKVDMSDPVDTVELSTKNEAKKEASTGKKVGLGIASWILPGLGQCINGQAGKGLAFFAGAVGATLLLGPVGTLGVGLWAAIDAAKNAKA